METHKSLKRDQHLPKSMDYKALRREGIEYLQQLSGKIWTDYNEHDPGVTLLEQICYALTDISYRTNIAIEKLLFYDNDYDRVSRSNALFNPNEIFPSSAVTLTDYRILILDQIEEVNNVWVDPVDESTLGIAGLYNVVIQMSNEIPEEAYDQVKDKVRRLLSANRNLSEDINDIKILRPLHVTIKATIDIKSNAVGEEVLSELFYRINNYLNPSAQFHTYEELLGNGLPLEKIFDIPSFTHGFILPADLCLKNDEYYVTKIAEIISAIPGIRNVVGLTIKKNGIRVYGNAIKVELGYFAQLDMSLGEGIELLKGGISYDYDASIIRHLYEVKLDKHKSANEAKQKWQFDKAVKPFPFSQISDFTSVQYTLPGFYGVGEYDLPDHATEERKAKARQLQGYLLMFDQIMANHLVQLQKINELFSVDDLLPRTYYGRLPVDFPQLSDIIYNPSNEAVQEVLAEFDEYIDRKNRVLDHLLSRFGENFSDDVSGKVKSLFGDMPKIDAENEIVQLKSNFLRDYVRLSGERSQAFDYFQDSIDVDNVPTFKRRVSYLLNIKNHNQRSLITHFSDIQIDVHEPGTKRIEDARINTHKGEEIHYRKTEGSGDKITFLIKERKTLEYLLSKGADKANYHIIEESDSKYLIIFYTSKKDFPVKISETDSVQNAQKIIRKLGAWFHEINSKSEGFHVVEHILLRPYGVDEFHFQILDRDDTVLFNSVVSHAYESQKLLAEDALIAGCDKANYKRVQVKSGGHIIILRDRHNIELARLADELPSEEGAALKVDQLVRYFRELEKDNSVYQKKIILTAVKVEDRKVNKDFYNARISIILPSWIARFQNEEFRLLLSSSIRQSIPAHVSADLVWLDIDGMRSFESVQKQWLQLRRKQDFDWKKINVLSDKLIKILTAPKNGRK